MPLSPFCCLERQPALFSLTYTRVSTATRPWRRDVLTQLPAECREANCCDRQGQEFETTGRWESGPQ